jgi:hypothetical protein
MCQSKELAIRPHTFPTRLRAIALLVAVLPVLLSLSSCFVRKRVVAAPGNRPLAPLLTATKEELIERVHRIADGLRTFSLRMDLSPSVGSVYVGEIKDYATLGGYILFRRPADIRIVATDPMFGSTVFDMASKDQIFRVLIPSQSRLVEGRNDAPPTSKKQLENLRPVAFLTSLLVQPPDPGNEITLLEEDTDEHESVYVLLIARREQEEFRLARALHFDRRNLELVRQTSFDPAGHLVSDTHYEEWKEYGGVPFPSAIDIKRPLDRYEVRLNVLTMRMNAEDITPEKFVLQQPEGTSLESIGQP